MRWQTLFLLVLLSLAGWAQPGEVILGLQTLPVTRARLEFFAGAAPSRFTLEAGELSIVGTGLPPSEEWTDHTFAVEGKWHERAWKGQMRILKMNGKLACGNFTATKLAGSFRTEIGGVSYP